MTYVEREGVLVTGTGRRIGWLEHGVEGGRPVGYLHGMPGSRGDLQAIYPAEALERFGLRVVAIDRGGYGDTDPAGLDRREVARDLLVVADHLEVASLDILAVSMGGTYALTAAALAPERVEKLVLVVPQALPYDDPAVVAGLDPAEQEEVARALGGPAADYEADYRAAAMRGATDSLALLRDVSAGWHPLEHRLAASDWAVRVARSLQRGLAGGHRGYYEDSLRTVRPLEVDLADVRCPVRIIAGTVDDWEPVANARRLAERLDDVALVELVGMGHFGPWVFPELVLGLLVGG